VKQGPEPHHLLNDESNCVQALIDALPFFVLLVDRDHHILAVNETTTEALAEVPASLLGRHCPRAIHGSDTPFPGCPLEETVRCGCATERVLHDAEQQKWFLSAVYPTRLRDGAGQTVYLHYARDITEQHHADLALRRSLEHHRALASIVQRLSSADSAERVLEALIDEVLALSWMGLSQQAAGYLLERGELRRVAKRNIDPQMDRLCARVPLGQCLCGQAALLGELQSCSHLDSGHDHRHPAMHDHGHVVLPLRDSAEVLGVVSFYLRPGDELDEPRTAFFEAVGALAATAIRRVELQRRRIQDRLQAMQTEKLAALGRLVAGVAHEINNPLAGIKAILWRMRRGEVSPEEEREYFDLLQDGLDRMETVVRQLLDFARVRSPRLARETVASLVQGTLALLPGLGRDQRARIDLDLGAAAALELEVDSDQIHQALTNLVLNGLYVTPAGEPLHLATRQRPGQLGIVVRDHGPGIPEALRDQIETPFFTTKPEGEGTGLGLSVTRSIADAHAGDLSFEFPAGGGTLVTLWLPLPGAAAAESESTPP